MSWFHPKTLFDKAYEIGIVIKGIDGTFELLGALAILLIPRSAVLHLTHWLTQNELSNDPHDFVATHVLKAGYDLANHSHTFAVLFLLTHGAVKVGLVIALLRQKLWAYPWALGALGLFLVYQIYLLIVRPTFSMGFLSILDAIIIWLVWREWHEVKADLPRPTPQ